MAKPIRIRQIKGQQSLFPLISSRLQWCSSIPVAAVALSQQRERESFYEGWSFCGDQAFPRQLNHQGLLQEQTFGPESAPNHSYAELQVNCRTLHSVGSDTSEKCPAGEFIPSRSERAWLVWILWVWEREVMMGRVAQGFLQWFFE